MIQSLRRRGIQLLLEVLIGMGLFVSAVLLILIYLPTSDRAAVQSDIVSQATNLARTLLDTTMDQDYAQINSFSGFVDRDHAERKGSALTIRLTYNLVAIEPNAATKLKDVMVTVSWTHGGRRGEIKLRGRKCVYW